MTRASRTVSTALSLLALGTLIAACSASPTESTEQGSQALECTTGDITHPCIIPSPTPLPPPKTVCAINVNGCPPSNPGPTFDPGGAGYDDPFVFVPGMKGGADCEVVSDFSASMTAAGCGHETLFHDVGASGGTAENWGVAFCPSAIAPIAAPAEIIACDQCTGTPPDGWVVVAWPLDNPCAKPGGGCAANGCRGI
jgi:hypothetical protein